MANQQLKDQVEDYKSRQHKKRRLKKVSFGVAICLVAVAIVGLVLPAVTLEYGKVSCGKEEHAVHHPHACLQSACHGTCPYGIVLRRAGCACLRSTGCRAYAPCFLP